MKRRTTIEIDDELLQRARRALGIRTTRGTIEEALRIAADAATETQKAVADKQASFLNRLKDMVDLNVLASDQMWR